MFKGCLPFIVLLLFGGYYASSTELTFLESVPGQRAEQIDSPSGQFSAQLWRCCDIYDYITAFSIRDRETGITKRQNLEDILGENSLAGGIYFQWAPSENYLVIITDNRVTSHGCDEALIYTGDGSALVYSSLSTSVCRSHFVDIGMSVLDFCSNDDILLSSGYRVTPSTGISIFSQETSCGDG